MELQTIQSKIYEVRGQKVMIDFDLAQLYETETKYLKRAVKRNIDRSPKDFMFEITHEEFENLRCQIGTSSFHGGIRYLPLVFTEQGVAMLASVLNSPKAIEVNVQIVRAFVYLRQYALIHKDLAERLNNLEVKYDDVYDAINYLLQKDKKVVEQKERKRIGFKED